MNTTVTRRETTRVVNVHPGDTQEELSDFRAIEDRISHGDDPACIVLDDYLGYAGDVCGARMSYFFVESDDQWGDFDVLLVEAPDFRVYYEHNKRRRHIDGDGDLHAYDVWRAAIRATHGPIVLSHAMNEDENEAAVDLWHDIG